MKMLLAVDGSKYSLDAVKCLVAHADWYRDKPEVELLFVHAPVPKLPGMSKVVGKNQIQRYYAEEGDAALADAKKLLERAGIRYQATLLVGQPADEIVKQAASKRCDLIFIGTRGRTAAGNMLLGSVATKVLHSATLPVMLVR